MGVGKRYFFLRLVATDSGFLFRLRLLNLHVRVKLCDATLLRRVRLLHIDVHFGLSASHLRLLVGVCERHLRHTLLVGLRNGYLLLLACGGDSHLLVLASLGNACFTLLNLVRNLYRTELLLLLNVSLSLVLRLRFCLLTEVDDIVGGVADVADVDVHQIQTELAQLGVDIILHLGEELVAVGVEFLNGHVGDDETHLSVNDVGDEVLLVVHRESEHTLSGVLHHFGVGADGNGDGRGHVYADVLRRDGARELAVYLHRLHREEVVALDDRPHEGSSAVVELRRLRSAGLTVNDEHLV